MSEQTECPYDLFISYAEADSAWVEGYLLDALEQAGVRCHSEAAFALGVPRLEEFERAVRESSRTLLILSPAYLAEGSTRFTDLLAQSYGLETATWPVIPLLLQPVELPPRLAMLTALDGTDPAGWPAAVERLCAELQRAAPGPAPVPSCPYPGMVPFGEADSARFFGREREVQELLGRLRLHPFLTVIGPSGSGKSSLVFAGLLPALRGSGLFGPGEWLVRSLRPGEAPLAALAEALNGDPADPGQAVEALLAAELDARRLLLVVDQFEELFTLSAAEEVGPFQRALLGLAGAPECHVVLTVRADFYPDLMGAPLWGEIQAHRVEVLPLDEEGLREAIVRPAEDAGVFVETALVERLVADAGREPGVLPLVQETLVLLWERVERRFLPLRAYEALVLARSAYGGPERTGLQVAMASRADAALAGLSAGEQAIARRVFLRLVQFGEGRADTRRQQPVAALQAAGDAPGAFDRVLEHLGHSRLLTLSGGEGDGGRRVDIAHESLIEGWPALQGWIGERREAEQARRRLEGKTVEWERLGRGSGGLLDEVELLEAEHWLESPDAADLGTGDALPALVRASRAAREEAEAQKRRTFRFRLGALGAIAVLIIVALAIGLWSAQQQAESQRQLAQQQEEAAATARAYADEQQRLAQAEAAARSEAEQQARRALSSQLAVQAQTAFEGNSQQGLLLAIEALSVTMGMGEPRVPAAEQILRDTLGHFGGRALAGHEQTIVTVIISPDGRWVVTRSYEDAVRLWDLTAPDPAGASIVLRGHEDGITTIAVSPDSRWLVTGSYDNTARLWNLTAPDPAAAFIVLGGHTDKVNAVAFSPDGRWVVTGSDDADARLWDVSALLDTGLTAPDPAAASVLLEGHEHFVQAVAFSPDGHWLITSSWDHTARLWDLTAPNPAADPVVLRGHGELITTIAVSPDGRWLATGSQDNTARLWDLTAPDPAADPIVLRGHEDMIGVIAVDPDSHWLVTGSPDGTARLWDLTASDPAADPVVLRGHEYAVREIAISPDGRWLVTGSSDYTARLWDLTAPDPAADPIVLHGHEGDVSAVAISPDGRWLVTGSSDYTARLWDLTASDPTADPIVLRGHENGIEALAISPDGRWLVTGSWDGTARLWNLHTHSPTVAPLVLWDRKGAVPTLATSPDGRWLVAADVDDTAARLWDLADLDSGALPVFLRGHESGIVAVAVSPDNRWLVTGSHDNTARLWDLTAEEPAAHSVVLRGHEEGISAVAFGPDGRWLVTGSWDRTARLWDLAASDPAAASVALRGHEDGITTIATSSDGRWLATGSRDNTVALWDLAAEDPSAATIILRGHESYLLHGREFGIVAIAFDPDGHWLATSSHGNTACLWDVSTLLDTGLAAEGPDACTLVLSGHEGSVDVVTFSPDGRRFITKGWDNTVRLWDLTASDPADSPVVLRGHVATINAVVVGADGRWLATGSGDTTVRLWDLAAKDPSATPIALQGWGSPVTEVIITPDGHWLIASSMDGAVRLWSLRLDELVHLACDTVGRNLTGLEWEQYFPGQPYRGTCPNLPPGRDAPVDAPEGTP